MNEILAFLLLFGCTPTTDIRIDDSLDRPGYYHEGVVYVRSNVPSYVLVHELYHSCQPQATNHNERRINEMDAHRIERIWIRNHLGE